MPINPSREQVQGTGTNLTQSVESGQNIASSQISNAFNFGTEAQSLRRRAQDMQEASTTSRIIAEQGELEMAQARNPSVIANNEAQARDTNASAGVKERDLAAVDVDTYRERYNAETEQTKALTDNTRATAGQTREQTRTADISNDEQEKKNAIKDKIPLGREKEVLSEINKKEGDAMSALGEGKSALSKGERSGEIVDAEIRSKEAETYKTEIENRKNRIVQEFLSKNPKLAEEEARAQIDKSIADAKTAIANGTIAEFRAANKDKLFAIDIANSEAEVESKKAEAALNREKAANPEKFFGTGNPLKGIISDENGDPTNNPGTPPPAAAPTPSATDRFKARREKLKGSTVKESVDKVAGGETLAPEQYPVQRIADSLVGKGQQQDGGENIASIRDKTQAAKVEMQMQTSPQASMLVKASFRGDKESDIDHAASMESLRLIDPDGYVARQKRVSELGLFEKGNQVNELDAGLLSTALDTARQNRAGRRQVSQLNKSYAKELRNSDIVDQALDVMEDADPRVAADYVGTIPDDKGVRRELGFQYFASIQGKIADTIDPAVKAPLKRELAKQALVVMPDAVKQVGAYWNSGDLINPAALSASMFQKEPAQLAPEERQALDSAVRRRSAFQQATKKLGLGAGKMEDLFAISGHDLDYYPPLDPIRVAAERAMSRMGPEAEDGTFIMKRHGNGYHAAFAPSSDPELSRQALSVQDAMFQYRTALHDGDEAENLQAAGISIDTLNRFGEEDSQSLSLVYGMFPYKEALPGMVKAISGYREKRLALGDSHELRREFEGQVTDVIMYQTKPGLEYNDPRKRDTIMRRTQQLIAQSYSPLEAPKDKFGRTALSVSDRLKAQTQA